MNYKIELSWPYSNRWQLAHILDYRKQLVYRRAGVTDIDDEILGIAPNLLTLKVTFSVQQTPETQAAQTF